MTASPVVEWRSNVSAFPVITSMALTGTGSGGAIPVGTTSSTVTARLYNNFAAAGGIADALNCVLAVYDDTVHDGLALTAATLGQYVQVEVTLYNGSGTGADSVFYAIGGSVKHPIPTNSGTISGTGANYVTIVIQYVVPSTATQGAVSQGLWVEYSSTA